MRNCGNFTTSTPISEKKHRNVSGGAALLASQSVLRQKGPYMEILALLSDPTAWAALFTLIILEVVLGIDNLVFIAILSNKLPANQQAKARKIGLSLALVMRIALLMVIGWIVTLQTPLFDLGIKGAVLTLVGALAATKASTWEPR